MAWRGCELGVIKRHISVHDTLTIKSTRRDKPVTAAPMQFHGCLPDSRTLLHKQASQWLQALELAKSTSFAVTESQSVAKRAASTAEARSTNSTATEEEAIFTASRAADAKLAAAAAREATSRKAMHLRPAAVFTWTEDGTTKEYVGDVVFVFTLPLEIPREPAVPVDAPVDAPVEVSAAAPLKRKAPAPATEASVPRSEPFCFVQWHVAVIPKSKLPCRCTALDESFSIVAWKDIVRKVVVIPQLGEIHSDCVQSVAVKVCRRRADGVLTKVYCTRVLAFSNDSILFVG
jgi:hypothetical protein